MAFADRPPEAGERLALAFAGIPVAWAVLPPEDMREDTSAARLGCLAGNRGDSPEATSVADKQEDTAAQDRLELAADIRLQERREHPLGKTTGFAVESPPGRLPHIPAEFRRPATFPMAAEPHRQRMDYWQLQDATRNMDTPLPGLVFPLGNMDKASLSPY